MGLLPGEPNRVPTGEVGTGVGEGYAPWLGL